MATWVMDSFFALTQILSLNSHRLFQAWQRTGCQWHGLAPTRLRTASLEPFHVVCKHCVTGTFSHVSTFSLAPLFESTLFHGHPPLCDIHACAHAHMHATNEKNQQNLDGPYLTGWGHSLHSRNSLAKGAVQSKLGLTWFCHAASLSLTKHFWWNNQLAAAS